MKVESLIIERDDKDGVVKSLQKDNDKLMKKCKRHQHDSEKKDISISELEKVL